MRRRRLAFPNVHFLCVYIREAHACDTWPIDGPQVKEPQTSEERVDVAVEFQKSCGLEWNIAVDGVEDAFLKAYSPWPFRLYVLQGSRVLVKTAPVDATHRTDEVEEAIRCFLAA